MSQRKGAEVVGPKVRIDRTAVETGVVTGLIVAGSTAGLTYLISKHFSSQQAAPAS